MAGLSLRLAGSPPTVRAARSVEVPNEFWLELIAEWGTLGAHPGREVELRVETFLSRLGWLAPACRRYRVSLEWEPALALLVQDAQQERHELADALEEAAPLDANAVLARLAESRFDIEERPLRPFQLRDVGKLLVLPHGANFSVPGTGKTAAAYAVYEAERAAGRISQLLVVAPLSAFDAWESEATACFRDSDMPLIGVVTDSVPDGVEIAMVNYHRLAANYDALADWVRQRPTLVLLDEAHRMKKGWAGQWGTACLNLAFSAERREVLTGTPAPQSPADLVALLDFLWPGQALRVIPGAALRTPPPPEAGRLIGQSLGALFVRTRKSELGLRSPDLYVHQVEPDQLQWAIYEALRDQYASALQVSMGDRVQLAQYGDIVMYLLEAATNPHLLSAGSSTEDSLTFRHPPLEIPSGSRLWDLLQQYNQYETPTKFRTLAQMVADNATAGRKTLVWSNFVRNLLTLERMFAAFEPALIYGAIPSATSAPEALRTREDELQRFRTDDNCMVLLANPASMSEGVSLHHVCHDAIYLERTFNAGQYLQSIDRIHRLGMDPEQETRITFLVSTGTVDEVVDDRVREKAARLGEMLDDPDLTTMALPDDENYGPAIDTHEDLVALFAHLRGDRNS